MAVYGDGGKSRRFTYVDDSVRGHRSRAPAAHYEVLNPGGDRRGLREMIQLVDGPVGAPARLDF